MLKVCKGQCNQCLFSENRIVPVSRFKQIVRDCKKNQTHFMCHKEENVVCGGYYEKLGPFSQMIRIAERLGVVQFVQPKANDE